MDEISFAAEEIARQLDQGQDPSGVADRLRSDYLNMPAEKFKELIKQIDELDDKGLGDDIEVRDKDEDGMPELKVRDNLNLPFVTIGYEDFPVVGTKEENSDTSGATGRNLQRVLGADDPYRNRVPEQRK